MRIACAPCITDVSNAIPKNNALIFNSSSSTLLYNTAVPNAAANDKTTLKPASVLFLIRFTS